MNVLEVRELRKTYPAFTLKDVSLDVPQGAIVGFIGRNGAGKSTTLKSVLGLVHPDGGTVRAFGLDYAANEAAIRRRIGVVLGGIDFYPKKKVHRRAVLQHQRDHRHRRGPGPWGHFDDRRQAGGPHL